MTARVRPMVLTLVVATSASPVRAQEVPPARQPRATTSTTSRTPPTSPGRHAQPLPPDTTSAPTADPPPADPPAAPAPADPPPAGTASPPAETAVAPVQTLEEPPAAAQAEPAAKAAERPPEDVQSFAEATMVSTGPVRFALNAFGDASFRALMPDVGDDSATFSLGTLALLINARLGGHILGTAEIAFDANSDNVQQIKLERLHIRWQDEHYFVVGGRMHTDIGYWNTAYHHGLWLQLPIARPRAVRGETSGGILPIHWVGLEGGLVVPVEASTLTVSGGIGNGRGQSETDITINTDSNNFKALKLKVEVLGLGWPDLRVGGSGLYDVIAPEPMSVRPALPDQSIDEIIANTFVAYRGVNLTLIAEGFAIWHVTDDDTFVTTDAYAVGGYRFGRVTPYLQLERQDAVKGVDPFYTPVPDMPTPSTPADRTQLIVGTRIDTSVWSALKGEYSILRAHTAKTIDQSVTINWSFGI